MIANQAIDDARLKVFELGALLALCRYANNKTRICRPSRKTLAEKSGMSISSLDKAIKNLQKLGYIEVTTNTNKEGKRTSNIYKINDSIHHI